MNKEEKVEKLQCTRKFFVTGFFISFVLLMFSTLMCMIFHDNQVQMLEKFFGLDSETCSEIVVFLLGLWKVFIIQFTLIPAITLWVIEKNIYCCKCK